jgi:hypothetical protein
MLTLLHQSRSLAIPLPEGNREEFLRKYKASLFEAYGCVMQGHVAVPDALLKETKQLQKYLESSYESAKPLKPKASAKSRKAGSAKNQ